MTSGDDKEGAGPGAQVVQFPIAPARRAPPNDNDIATALIAELRDEVAGGVSPVVCEGKAWVYVDNTWLPQERQDLLRRVCRYHKAKTIAGEVVSIAYRQADGAVTIAMNEMLDAAFFASAAPGVSFANCFVRVGEMGLEAMPHDPAQRARYVYEFDFDAYADPVSFLAFLDEIFANDDDRAERITLVREFLGAALMGLAPLFERALILVGSGDNGKSMLLDIVRSLFAKELVSSIEPRHWGDDKYLAMLAGKTLNMFHELGTNEIGKAATLKSIISGQEVVGRQLYERAFFFQPRAAHLFACNNMPKASDSSDAFWRRFITLQLTRKFAREKRADEVLKPCIAERAKIINWAIAAVPDLVQRREYALPPSTANAEKEWRSEQDSVWAFFTARLAQSKDLVKAADLYAVYRVYCDERSLDVVNLGQFGKRLRKLGLKARRKADGNYYSACLLPD